MNALRRHASFANTVSALALFIALGGTSYAATSEPDQPARLQSERAPAERVPGARSAEQTDESAGPTEESRSEDPPGGEAVDAVETGSDDDGSGTSEEAETDLGGAPEGRQTHWRRRGDGHGRPKGIRKKEKHEGRGGGPPPWAPAHGYRAKQAGRAPGGAGKHAAGH